MHGLENQTRESINMLIDRGTPFVVALNKIDRLHEWKTFADDSSFKSLKHQSKFTQQLFQEQYIPALTQLNQMEINAELYWKNKNPLEFMSIVPTSAITGEGLPDLLAWITHYCQKYQAESIKKNHDDFSATVLEVKKIDGLGSTVDIILVNGTLQEEDKIVLSGFQGPIVTTVRSLLTPHPMKEMRIKNEYLHHKVVVGSMGVKLLAQGLESALAGCSIYKYRDEEELEAYKMLLAKDIKKIKKKIKLKKEGVGVAASTLGSLEALLVFLKESKIPVSTICIGDVSKSDLFKVLAPFVAEENPSTRTEFLTMLCFDVKILPEAQKFADDYKIKIIKANIIYHLFDGFTKHVENVKEIRRNTEGKDAVFPCVLKTVMVFNKKSPIILGVDVVKGILRAGTPLCIKKKGGRTSKLILIPRNHQNRSR